MTKDATPTARVARPAPAVTPDQTERQLGRAVATGLPLVSVFCAVAVGSMSSLGPAILILAAGALLGTIALFWASVRTLGGDAPLPTDMAEVAGRRYPVDNLAERKRTLLRALKDLEHEHAVGKIDDEDYEAIAAPLREQIKALMREMDADIEPQRQRAEALAREYLEREGIGAAEGDDEDDATASPVDEEKPAPEATSSAPTRISCPKCETKNDVDAAFCKKCGTALGAEAKTAPPDGANASS